MDKITQTLIEEFSLKEFQVVNTIKLLDDGNTVPFIARYRKEVTGELSDEILRAFCERLEYLRRTTSALLRGAKIYGGRERSASENPKK